jgi:ubiquitin-conjugating enzyme E2 D
MLRDRHKSPYSGGIFHLSWYCEANDPRVAPKVRSLTPIYHPNIDAAGNICMDILSDRWFAVQFLESIILSLLSLISDPSGDDPLVPAIATTYIQDRELYEKNTRNYIANYAGKDQCWEEYGVTPDMFGSLGPGLCSAEVS